MTILSAQSICHAVGDDKLGIEPFVENVKQYKGMSYGVTAAGYDIRVGNIQHPDRDKELVEQLYISPGQFILAASLEHVRIPDWLQVTMHDKSTWARRGLAVQTTVLEPGWFGHITLELSNHGRNSLLLQRGMPIAQLVFHQLDTPTDRPYEGKYQNQSALPTEAIMRHDDVHDLMEDLNNDDTD